MKYIANPIEVDAFEIVDVTINYGKRQDGLHSNTPPMTIKISGRPDSVNLTSEMISRYTPTPGDYYVVQADGYVYVNPKDVFERKYHPAG